MYLNCHTYFSLRYGTLSVDKLVELAKRLGVRALALTDIHNTSACYDFVKACRRNDIHPVVGMEFRRENKLLYIAIARNLEGFEEINTFYSQYALQSLPFPELPPHWSHVYVIYPWERRDQVSLHEHEWLGISVNQVGELFRSRYRHRQDRLVVLQPVSFEHKLGHNMHRLLRAIQHNTLLSKLSTSQHAPPDEVFMSPDELKEAFSDYPQILLNSDELLARCDFDFAFNRRRSRQTFTGDKYEDMLLLEKLAMEGAEIRYGNERADVIKRLHRELEIIDRLDFNAYFLITWDFIQYAKARGHFHVGRGSGANSLAAYCMGITDVDPIELDLYFERFLNPKRTSPPDFDIDFSWKARDSVIDYAFKRYRSNYTALLATYQTFQYRGLIRELGKVFGMTKREMDQLAANPIPHQQAPDKVSGWVLRYSERLKDFPNHLSIHAGGILISEKPIHAYTATDMPPKGFPITHFDMYVAEDIGLHKFDILSQRGLGHIKDCMELVRRNQGKAVDIHNVDELKKDPQIRSLLRSGKTIGCFYIESPAMRQLIRKLNCDDYLTLVAASSIIRPGVSNSGMMRAYIERHNGKKFEHIHPKLEELLRETYGVMVYQEDVIKVAHKFAGLDLAEADLLRRAMSGKFRSKKEFDRLADTFFLNCRERQYSDYITQELWRQIQGFSAYSFSKAHSASFAVESFQSLYLKTYFPLEFMVSVVNNFGGFYDTEMYLYEAKRWGAEIQPPCINRSQYLTNLDGKNIFLGFTHIKDLGEKIAHQIIKERKLHGAFIHLEDFMRRVKLAPDQLMRLIRVGALRFIGKTKANLMWEAKLRIQGKRQNGQKEVLFDAGKDDLHIPELKQDLLEDAYDEMELLGFPLLSPFEMLLNPQLDCITAKMLAEFVGQEVNIVGYLVTRKETRTVKDERMQFANFIDKAGDMFDVTLFPDVAKHYVFSGRALYRITGKVAKEFGTYSLEMSCASKLLFKPDPRLADA